MRSINKYSNLCIVSVSEREIWNSSTKFDNTISINASVFSIFDLNALRIYTIRVLICMKGFTIIISRIISNRMNLAVIIAVFIRSSFRTNDLKIRFLIWIGCLIYRRIVNRISFSFKNIKRLLKFLRTQISKFSFNASTNHNNTLFFNLLSYEVSGIMSGHHSAFSVFI